MASILGVFIFGESHIIYTAENLLFARIGFYDGAFMMIHFFHLDIAEIARLG